MRLPQPAIKSTLAERSQNSRRGRSDNPATPRARGLQFWIIVAAFLALAGSSVALAQQGREPVSGPPSTDTIVQQMVIRNQQRAEEIGPYTSRRHYHVEYVGFPHTAEADMVVDMTCNGPSSKRFDIISESGSHGFIDHVFKDLLKTEQKAAANQSDTALTPANYNFTLIGSETVQGRETYVLKVEPKEPRALLYRGTIWVDKQEYAVVKIDAQPVKNASFWIRDTEIHHVYSKTGDFWLPAQNRSESNVRLGGTALLTIDYGDYRFLHAQAEQPGPSMHSSKAMIQTSALNPR